ncbi:hypothetical protein Glove_232g121 [Diversispora epigaea]|uniref:Uncharacterized protein n=1 Tax=Diversispora epigaea TaxID=1348612 RepID=A0A397IEG6_9GLOM|nr:hypothetical protein Glove_232g121 [Diversispora epigaea]
MSGMEFTRFITECIERSNGPENNIQFSTPDKHSSVAKKPLKNYKIRIYKTNSEALYQGGREMHVIRDKVNKVLANYKSKEYKEAIELMETMGKPQSDLANNLKTNQGNQQRLLETLAKEEILEKIEGGTNVAFEEEIARIKSELEINWNNKEK